MLSRRIGIALGTLGMAALSVALPHAQAGNSDSALLVSADKARGDAEGASWSLAVDDSVGGKASSNALDVKTRGTNFLAEYTAPAAQKGEKLLERDRNMWFIKPGASKPVPISPRQRLLGAASYGDLASTVYSTGYTSKRLPDEGDAAVFDLTAKSAKETYENIKLWVSKRDGVATKAEYHAKTGATLKTAAFEYGNKGKSGSFISKMTITSGTDKTTLTYSKVNFAPVPPSTFQSGMN